MADTGALGPANTGQAPQDRLATLSKPTSAEGVRTRLLEMLRRDLVGPHPDLDPDLAREVLEGTNPSNWYLTGYLGPRRHSLKEWRPKASTDEDEQSERQLEAQRSSEGMEQGAPGKSQAADDGATERPPVRSFEPSSLGLTVLLPRDAMSLEARVTWGDYVVEPPLDEAVFLPGCARCCNRGRRAPERAAAQLACLAAHPAGGVAKHSFGSATSRKTSDDCHPEQRRTACPWRRAATGCLEPAHAYSRDRWRLGAICWLSPCSW